MSRAVFVREHGGPEVLEVAHHVPDPPGAGEVTVRNHAIGLNFIDTYQRSGLYRVPLPFIAGNEGAGEVVSVGDGVEDLRIGDRITYSSPIGAYSELRNMPAGRAARIPEGIDYETAAAATLKGITAYYLLFQTWPLKAGDTILWHAAAGGVGLIATQWASSKGARVMATASTAAKLELARAAGADVLINYREEDFARRVREETDGRGVDVVYDGVGKDTFEGSLDSLRPRGLMVSFGNASGPVSVPNLGVLSAKGSLYLTRPSSGAYTSTTEELRTAVAAVFDAILGGVIEVSVDQRFPLEDVAEAHRALEARETTGSTVLIP